MKILQLSAFALAAVILHDHRLRPDHPGQQRKPHHRHHRHRQGLVLADTATVHIGFIAYGPDSDAAYATGSRLSNAIIKALTDAGVPATPSKAKTRTSPPSRTIRSRSSPPPRRPSASSRSPRAGPSAPRRRRRQGPRPRRQSRSQPVRPDRLEPQRRKRPAGRSRRQSAPARPHRRRRDGQRSQREARRPPLRQQRNPGRTARPLMRAMAAARTDGCRRSNPRHQSPSDRKIRHRLRCLRHRIGCSRKRDPPMPVHKYRELKPTPEAEAVYRRWLANLNDEFTRHQTPDIRSQIVRDELFQLYLGHPYGGPAKATLNHELAMHTLIGEPRPAQRHPRARVLRRRRRREIRHPQAPHLVLADV